MHNKLENTSRKAARITFFVAGVDYISSKQVWGDLNFEDMLR